MANFLIQGQTTQTVLLQLVPLSNSSEILWSYTFLPSLVLTVDARVLTRKLWTARRQTDRQIVSDYNSSLSTLCSGELKKPFRKMLWRKDKSLKMSNFTFFHNVFYAICILKSTFLLLSAASFNLGLSQNSVLGNGFRPCNG